jgi:hypothetical protein
MGVGDALPMDGEAAFHCPAFRHTVINKFTVLSKYRYVAFIGNFTTKPPVGQARV